MPERRARLRDSRTTTLTATLGTLGTTINGNPGFETNFTGWTGGFNGTAARANDQAAVGSWSGKFTPTGGNQFCGFSSIDLVALPNTYYYLSSWLRTAQNQTVILKVDWKDAGAVAIGGGSEINNGTISPANTWRFYQGLVLSPPLTAFVTITSIATDNPAAAATWWIDEARLQNTSDVTGSGTVSIGPERPDNRYVINGVAVRVTTDTLSPRATVYRNAVNDNNIISGTEAGANDSDNEIHEELYASETLKVQWIKGDIGALATATFSGEIITGYP